MFSTSVTSASLNETSYGFLTNSERLKIEALIENNHGEISILPFKKLEVSEQFLNLGSWLVVEGYRTLGQKVLKHALNYSSSFQQYELGYIYNLLASTAELDEPNQAIAWYKEALKFDDISACVNFGVFYERRKSYQNAAEIYRQCTKPTDQVDVTKKEIIALAYINLGTLHYNGLLGSDFETERVIGGKLWKASYKLNPYDIDINYNLGLYQNKVENNDQKARYHYSVCAWILGECARALAHPKLVSLSSESQYLTDLLKAKGVERKFLIEDRAASWLSEPTYLNTETPYGVINLVSSEDGNVSGIEMTFANNQADNAIAIVNRLVFVDMFSKVNALTYAWGMALQPMEIKHLGQMLSLKRKGDMWCYQINFEEQSYAKSS
ncbi:hypothetical protein [Thalassotalea profundi]|nr:hypothetical protein [Thalassotalea profundi]